MSENPFSEAVDEAEEEATENDSVDLDGFFDDLASGPKEKTIGFAVSEEMHTLYHELQNSDDVEVDLAETFRDHIEKQAHRHEEIAEQAQMILEARQ
jgi:hypothetical protein